MLETSTDIKTPIAIVKRDNNVREWDGLILVSKLKNLCEIIKIYISCNSHGYKNGRKNFALANKN